MANRFWVGGTGTWNSSSTAFWAATSGGAGGQTVPGASDVAIFDASSGGGTVTVDSPNGAGVVTLQQITMGAFTGTLDFATNNNNVTLSVAFSGTGTGTRTLNLGSGTWTISNTAGSANVWDLTTVTNLTFSGASAAIVITGATASIRTFVGGGFSYGSLDIQANSSRGTFFVNSANTFGSFSAASGSCIQWFSGGTNTITNGFTLVGTSSSPILMMCQSFNGIATLSLGGACTISWGAIARITKAGAGSLSVTNGIDLGVNTNVTITPPSVGGGQTVIGG